MKSTKYIALLLSVLLVLSCFAGCGNSGETTAAGESSAAETVVSETEETAVAEETEEAAQSEEPTAEESESATGSEVPEEEAAQTVSIHYPIDGNITISVWRTFGAMMFGDLMDDYYGLPLLSNIQDATGVTLEFVSVDDMAGTENFNLMIASGDWCDLVGLSSYTGGMAKAYEDDLCYDLAPYLEEYMPDYYEDLMWLKENYPTAYKQTVTNEGNVLSVYDIYDEYVQEQGLVFRTDWAAECGLDDIVTIDDLNTYLDYVVTTYGPRYGMTPSNGGVIDGITGAFGIAGFDASGSSVDVGLFLEGDTVVSTMTSDKFRTYIEWFSDQYAKGAVYYDFYSESYGPDWINSYFSDGDVAISFLRSDKISTIINAANEESFDLTPTTSIVMNAGDTFTFGDEQTMTMSSYSIMTTTEHFEECMYFMNWFFTDEGYIVSNYGEEGLSFNYNEDGEVRFTDLIMESGYSNLVQVRNTYTAMIFSYYKDVDAFFYTYADIEQEAMEIWSQISDSSRLPSFELDGDASVRFSSLASDVVAYAATVVLQWLTCQVPLDDAAWDAYVETCNAMGLEEAVAIYQDGYDLFLQR